MRQIRFVVALTAACCLIGAGCVSAVDAPNAGDSGDERRNPASGAANDATSAITPPEAPPDWLTRQSLTGDWGGSSSRLEQQGITVKPRLTQFYQGLTAGEGEHGFEYGSKADVLVTADLHKLGFWDGFSMTVHAEYNFGNSVNGRGGVLIPVNSALNFPGMDGSDAFDFSSVYFGQDFGDSVSLVFGKMNMIDIVSGKAFMGGAGIDSFWNLTFVAPPTGTVPAYMFGVLTSVRTEDATYRLWVYDPNSGVNKGFDHTFDGGVTIRGSIEFPVTIAGRAGHQGFTALYSNQSGTDLASLDGILAPVAESRNRRRQEFTLLLRVFVRPVSPPGRREPRRGRRTLRSGRGFGRQSEHDALVAAHRPGRQGDGSRAAQGQLGHRLLLRRHEPVPEGRARSRRDAQERAGRRALLQLRADPVVRAGRGPAGHQAWPRQRHRRDSGCFAP